MSSGPEGVSARRAQFPTSPTCVHRDGKALGDLRKPWRRAYKRAGVGGQLFHDMRRTSIRSMVLAGPERVAMAVSGHRTCADRYNIVSGNDLVAAAERTQAYVDARRKEASAVPLEAARGRRDVARGQNTDNHADNAPPVGSVSG